MVSAVIFFYRKGILVKKEEWFNDTIEDIEKDIRTLFNGEIEKIEIEGIWMPEESSVDMYQINVYLK